jgi:poly(3-hydroxyalkanoate) synthetase
LKTDEFLSLLSRYFDCLVELRAVLIELGYPVHYLEQSFLQYKQTIVSSLPMGIGYDLAPYEIVYKRGKARLLHYLCDSKDRKGNLTPLLIVYAPINRFHILDLSRDQSVVRKLISEGLDVYLLDWGYPGPEDFCLSLDDYVNYVENSLQVIKSRNIVDKVSILGYCWGGIIALIYSALNNKQVRSLILMGTPVVIAIFILVVVVTFLFLEHILFIIPIAASPRLDEGGISLSPIVP